MKRLKECSIDLLRVKIAQFINNRFYSIISYYRELFIDVLDEEKTVLLIGFLGEHLFVCHLIWDENKEEFIKCKNLGLYNNKTGEAQKLDANDLEDVILKLYSSK